MSGMTSFLQDPADLFGGRAAGEAAEVGAEASRLGTEELRRQFDIQQGRLEPFFEQAAPAVDMLAKFSGSQGRDAQAQSFQEFKDSPGQKFLKSRGTSAVNDFLKKMGPQDDNVMSALESEGGDIAAQDFQNQLNLLARVGGIAQTSGSQLGQGGSQFATQFGQQGQGLAGIQSAGIQNQQQATNNALGQGAQLAGAFAGRSNNAQPENLFAASDPSTQARIINQR